MEVHRKCLSSESGQVGKDSYCLSTALSKCMMFDLALYRMLDRYYGVSPLITIDLGVRRHCITYTAAS